MAGSHSRSGLVCTGAGAPPSFHDVEHTAEKGFPTPGEAAAAWPDSEGALERALSLPFGQPSLQRAPGAEAPLPARWRRLALLLASAPAPSEVERSFAACDRAGI